MVFGYAPIFTKEQNLDIQLRAILKYGISEKNIIQDIVSGAQSYRKNRGTFKSFKRWRYYCSLEA